MAMLSPSGSHPSFIAGRVRKYRYFFLNLVPQKKVLTVACGGWERCAQDYWVQRSDFEFYGIECVVAGKGLLTLNGREHRLMPGSVFAYRPFTPHTIQTDRDDPLEKYFVDFSGRDASGIIGRKVLGSQGVAYLHHCQPILDLYEQMLEAGLKGGTLAPKLCCLLLEMLSVRVEEYAHNPADFQGRARQAFERCRGELQRHFRTIQTVSELAQLSHLDPAYLARLYARFGGESPYKALTRLKVNEAAAHLLGGEKTVKEVAAQVGFSDPYHFSRVFKRHHGMPPDHFRRARIHAPMGRQVRVRAAVRGVSSSGKSASNQ